MIEPDILQSIRLTWLQRAIKNLAHSSNLSDDLYSELDRFFDSIVQYMSNGDSEPLDNVLKDWAISQTQTDLESVPNNLTRFINELLLLTHQTLRENTDPQVFSGMTDALVDCFGYSFTKISELEIRTKSMYAFNQIAELKTTIDRLEKNKSNFISIAAHELKTPLTLIEGYATMLHDAEKKKKAVSPDLIIIDGILTGSKRLKNLIEDMIDASVIDNGLLELSLQPVIIGSVFNALQDEMGHIIESRNLSFTILKFQGFNEKIIADPERLSQVFRNILLNAIKYTPDGGHIKIDGRKLPGFLEITISDTGIGIDTDNQLQIFNKFAQLGSISLHSSSKTQFKGGGAGLGLHIAKGIIEAHGGTIWVESQGMDEIACTGSTFHIMLPMRRQDYFNL